MTEGILARHGLDHTQCLEQLLQMVESRAAARRRNSHFRPLSDIDFGSHERLTHSYVRIPRLYPIRGSAFDELSRAHLNTEVVTVPHGSEHTSFLINRKNDYECNLF
jgi:histone deacetylase complex regulatory component SIN3